MVGIAWAANQHIGARDRLAVMPADDDVLAIYDTDAGAGLGIEVSVFRGDNLNAIVNADTVGSATPGVTTYDSDDAAGTSYFHGTSLGGINAIVMALGVEEADGDTQTYIELDGVNETVDVLKTLTAPSISGGIIKEAYTDSESETVSATICKKLHIMGATANKDITFNLPADTLCSTSSSMDLIFTNMETSSDYELILEPNGTDIIQVAGSAACGAGVNLICDENGTTVRLIGVYNSTWLAIVNGTCACGS